jgi:predicted aspartyl protease
MLDAMGSFRIDVEIESYRAPIVRRVLHNVLVDTGAELSCFPGALLDELGIQRTVMRRFRQADGSVFERWTGPASIYVVGVWTVDQVIFGEPDDLTLLGSHSLEGLNLRIDPVAKRLTDAGPMLLAATH